MEFSYKPFSETQDLFQELTNFIRISGPFTGTRELFQEPKKKIVDDNKRHGQMRQKINKYFKNDNEKMRNQENENEMIADVDEDEKK